MTTATPVPPHDIRSFVTDIPLTTSTAGHGAASVTPAFLTVTSDRVRLNGDETTLEDLPDRFADLRTEESVLPVLVSAPRGVTAQRLTDLLATLRDVPQITVTVLEPT